MWEPPRPGSGDAGTGDEDGLSGEDVRFTVSGGFRLRLPSDLDEGVTWTGLGTVAAATFATLAFLIAGTLEGWSGLPNAPVPTPEGYYSLLLLVGVLLLVLTRGRGGGSAYLRWLRVAACLAAGTGGALIVAQVVGNLTLLVPASGQITPEPPTYAAATFIGALGGLADAVAAALAVVLALLVYERCEPAAGAPASIEGVPIPVRLATMRPAVASLAAGVAFATACLVVFAVGNSRIPSYEPPSNGVGTSPGTAITAIATPGVALSAHLSGPL